MDNHDRRGAFPWSLRYSELQKCGGVLSQRMLILSLKTLVDDGLVTRTVYPTNPPRVHYGLTERGLAFTSGTVEVGYREYARRKLPPEN